MKMGSMFIVTLVAFVLAAAGSAAAQTTAFTYQGRLTDNSIPPTGMYSMQFALFEAPSGGTAIATQNIPSISVANGIFTVTVDFGACAVCFDGSDRYLEVTVGSTTLAPRQHVTSAPYAIRARNAETLGGMSAGNFVLKSGDTMSGVLNMGNNKITGLAAPTVATDAVNKAYADSLLTPRYNTVSWASATFHSAGIWTTIPASSISLTTTAKPLLITMNLSLNGGSHGSCRPIIDGVWAGSYGGLINPGDPFWQEGLINVGLGGGWARWNLNRIYPGVPAGNHNFQIQCVTDAATMQSCGGTIGCSFAVIELH